MLHDIASLYGLPWGGLSRPPQKTSPGRCHCCSSSADAHHRGWGSTAHRAVAPGTRPVLPFEAIIPDTRRGCKTQRPRAVVFVNIINQTIGRPESSWGGPSLSACSPCPHHTMRRWRIDGSIWPGRGLDNQAAGGPQVEPTAGVGPGAHLQDVTWRPCSVFSGAAHYISAGGRAAAASGLCYCTLTNSVGAPPCGPGLCRSVQCLRRRTDARDRPCRRRLRARRPPSPPR